MLLARLSLTCGKGGFKYSPRLDSARNDADEGFIAVCEVVSISSGVKKLDGRYIMICVEVSFYGVLVAVVSKKLLCASGKALFHVVHALHMKLHQQPSSGECTVPCVRRSAGNPGSGCVRGEEGSWSWKR